MRCVGGADSDVMVDMIIRCGGEDKTTFVFFDTGLEYKATKEHIHYLEQRHGISIQRVVPRKSIPISCKEFGVPMWSKFASDMIYRLQSHDFQWEDEPFDVLIKRYPTCSTALKWWCNVKTGNTTQHCICGAPYMKEFIMRNPPTFKISDKCCFHTKKNMAHSFEKSGGFDLSCLGIRKSEGGVRAAAYTSCFSEHDGGIDRFRPVFYLRDEDKRCYCSHYNISHSRCYTEYGLSRTGCAGCPFGKGFEKELEIASEFEPNLAKAANSIFGKSYEYMRAYLRFREKMKLENKQMVRQTG